MNSSAYSYVINYYNLTQTSLSHGKFIYFAFTSMFQEQRYLGIEQCFGTVTRYSKIRAKEILKSELFSLL